MERLRLAVKKDGALQFLSHLDFARAVRYVIIRAKLPICYSEGFNPHMKLSFASALGVGVSADVEYLDMELSEKLPVADVMARMNAMAPDGFAVLDGKYVDAKAPKLMAIANYAVYTLRGPLTEDLSQDGLNQILAKFNEAPSVFYEKVSHKGKHRVRTIDVKQHVVEAVHGNVKAGNVYLTVGIYQTGEGAIKPSQVWEILGNEFGLPIHTDMMLARRTGIFVRKEDGKKYSLFEG